MEGTVRFFWGVFLWTTRLEGRFAARLVRDLTFGLAVAREATLLAREVVPLAFGRDFDDLPEREAPLALVFFDALRFAAAIGSNSTPQGLLSRGRMVGLESA